MDAKSKANFINAVASGQVVPCINCGTANTPGDRFCITCGAPLQQGKQSAANDAPVFEPAVAPPAAQAGDVPCPGCGTANTPGDRFCIACDAPLQQEEQPAANDAPVFEPAVAPPVAQAGDVLCPGCGTANTTGDRFCIACGAPLQQEEQPAANDAPIFAPITESPFETQAEEPAAGNTPILAPVAATPPAAQEQASKYIEPASVFAEGLPSWDIVPPQIMVKRR